jgi:hypothetical protein
MMGLQGPGIRAQRPPLKWNNGTTETGEGGWVGREAALPGRVWGGEGGFSHAHAWHMGAVDKYLLNEKKKEQMAIAVSMLVAVVGEMAGLKLVKEMTGCRREGSRLSSKDLSHHGEVYLILDQGAPTGLSWKTFTVPL